MGSRALGWFDFIRVPLPNASITISSMIMRFLPFKEMSIRQNADYHNLCLIHDFPFRRFQIKPLEQKGSC